MSTEELLGKTLDSDDEKILGISITIDDIRSKISQLAQTADGEPLRNAMQDLKIALRANPEACNLLMPEEIGEMVKHLYKITNTAVLLEKSKAVGKNDKLSQKKINEMLMNPETLKNLADF